MSRDIGGGGASRDFEGDLLLSESCIDVGEGYSQRSNPKGGVGDFEKLDSGDEGGDSATSSMARTLEGVLNEMEVII